MRLTIAGLYCLFCVMALTVSSQAQDAAAFDGHNWKAPYSFPSPNGWGIERFLVPIAFAPEIKYTGVEDIRFTPGWADAKSEQYWSYVFLWYLEGKVMMDERVVTNNLKNYYAGLLNINGGAIPKDKIIPVAVSVKEVKREDTDLKTFHGVITMTDYMTQKPITLNGKIHLRECAGENKTFVFHELSPKDFNHVVWLAMDELVTNFNCKN